LRPLLISWIFDGSISLERESSSTGGGGFGSDCSIISGLPYEDNDLLSLYAKYHALGYWHVTHGGIYKSSSKGSALYITARAVRDNGSGPG